VTGIVLAGALFGLAASPGGQASRRPLHGANFWVKCYFSHVSNDDPIVHPRRPGVSHHHTFFGNRSTDAYSTPMSLRAGKTNCRDKADRAAYWVPTLYLDGQPVKPASIGVYHKMKTLDVVRPFPADFADRSRERECKAPAGHRRRALDVLDEPRALEDGADLPCQAARSRRPVELPDAAREFPGLLGRQASRQP
jgi:hypothetical protein